VRALLDLVRENKAAVQDQLCAFKGLLVLASVQLKILDPGYGEEELIKSMATEVAILRELEAKTEPQQSPGGA